uniref:Palmitoyltransferase n=1 Tax=Babesia bovis TaxID=5865 RepID=A7AND7_BABBO|eukprot:XP_001611639.1 DHHC zinc finger domain containing protein [Babesia bovis T2Bo]
MTSLDRELPIAEEAGISTSSAPYRSTTRSLTPYLPYSSFRVKSGHNDNDDPLISSQDRNKDSQVLYVKPVYAVHPVHKGSAWFHYLPAFFVLSCFIGIYWIFLCYHLKPAVGYDLSHYGIVSNSTVLVVIVTHILGLMFVLNYVLCATVDPGRVPDTLEWKVPVNGDQRAIPSLCETKRSGERRICKWCILYKPDRAHHCTVCGRCVLMMDHHCPWVHNCIGWGNHKYFYLCLFYASALSSMISILSFPTVRHVLKSPMVCLLIHIYQLQVPFSELSMLVIGEILSVTFAVICTSFLGFHIWLMCEAYTTIEFCEKRFCSIMWPNRSLWSGTLYENICATLGSNPLLWLVPVDNRSGDGIHFIPHVQGLHDEDGYDEHSAFLKMARETNQFEPIVEV